jgi:DNA-binding response OmpR family regulator
MDDSKILVVDDESRMRKLVRDYLTKNGYGVVEAADGEEAINIFMKTKGVSLVILDVMMPKLDGYEVAEEIRKLSDVPIIMLTAKSSEADELKGFELGIDEYITKPFSPKILVARVEAVLRRSLANDADELLNVTGIELNISAHRVLVDGEEVELSYKEFELLNFFMKNQGVALSREKILNNVWNYDYFGDARTIDTHVKKLRNKLGKRGDYIKTIWGMGYKFEVETA